MDATLSDALVGRLLDGRYRVEALIARGGMATVYTALDTRLDRIVALKVMHPQFAHDDDFVARFNREAKAAARLSHPNVVSVYDQGEDDGSIFLAMEYVQGRTLRDLLRERGRLTPAQALSILEPVVSALRAAHAAGLVHRDIKPENVLLADDGRIKVADFGLARALAVSDTSATTGVLIGTVAYLAPEQVERNVADERSDIYAVGTLLYEMLVGTPPYDGATAWAVATRHVQEDVPLPSETIADMPAELDEIVHTATRRDPEQRFADASALLEAIRGARVTVGGEAGRLTVITRPDAAPSQHTQVLAGPIAPPPGAKADKAKKSPGRRRTFWIVAALIALLVGVSAGLGYYFAIGRYTHVPGVVSLTPQAATTKLHDAGLKVRTGAPVFSKTVAVGLIGSTDPGSGHRIGKNGTVTLHLSKGPEVYAVPQLANKKLADAEKALKANNLVLGNTNRDYSDTVKEGYVISTTPPAGQKLEPGSKVDLLVSKGPAPVSIPNVVGKNITDAQSQLVAVGLKVTPKNVFSDTVPKDVVVAQDPVEGSPGHRGDTVTLSVSQGPELFPVPNVVGMKLGDARNVLEAAGFKVDVTRPFGGNTVRAQNPGGGSQEKKGTTVRLVVY
ncbi:MAG: eukaryotic-like serine/threonine-protein kinase [Frankiales bacterium]|nr:eukaryotic-like serine/threonine-protein kinase [Frankiales bacterium]